MRKLQLISCLQGVLIACFIDPSDLFWIIPTIMGLGIVGIFGGMLYYEAKEGKVFGWERRILNYLKK